MHMLERRKGLILKKSIKGGATRTEAHGGKDGIEM